MGLKWKGELGDGHVHMTAHEYVEHHTAEQYETAKQTLRKMANNPALAEEVKSAIRFAVFRMDDILWLRKINEELRETIENVKEGKKP